MTLSIIHPGLFANRHAVTQRPRMKTDEAGWLGQHRTINCHSIDGIDPIQNIELNVRFGGCLQAQTHRAAVSVKPAADVLDIKDERIKAFELFRRGFVSLAIE